MLKTLFATLALAFSMNVGLTGFANADEAFTCIDTNKTLHFVLYEDASGMRGGHMYLNGIQTAVLDTVRINDISIRATIVGNTAPTEFIFNSDRKQVFIEINGTNKVVCNARVNK